MSSEPAPRIASADGLDVVFRPHSVAVVGASPRADAVGHRLLRNVLAGGFRGRLHAVHPSAGEVLGVPAFPTVEAIPGPVDLALVAVPAEAVLDVARSCARKGVRALVVVSAGFREAGSEGAVREQALRSLLDQTGMRLVGPNCLGVLNTEDAVRLHAIFGASAVVPGPVGLMTQSGALGIALLERAAETGLGVARFASMGNKLDVSGNDLLLLWGAEPDVAVVAIYLESFGNPRNFVRIAGEVSRRKPILAVKAGRTEAGARAAASHTGALLDPDAAVDALLAQSGVLRVSTVEALLDAALAAALQPLPAGDRVAIVTNSGGPAILATDALGAAGLRLAELAPATTAALTRCLPPEVKPANPLDLIAGASPQAYGDAVAGLLADPGIDAVLVIETTVAGDDLDIARAVEAAVACGPRKTVLFTSFGAGAARSHVRDLVAHGIPTYAFPENAVAALGALRRLHLLRHRPSGRLADVRADLAAAKAALAAPTLPGGWMRQDHALTLVEAFGVPVAPFAFAASAAEAAERAPGVGPWVLKAEAQGVVHKSDVGGVRLGLGTRSAVVSAFLGLHAGLAARGHPMTGALVMEQVEHVEPRQEMMVGATRHERYGPLVAVGFGGVFAEALRDTVYRLAPVTDVEAAAMVDALRGRALLGSLRGRPGHDVGALRDAIERVAALVSSIPQVAELDVNPFLLRAQGGVAVDARVRLASP